MFRFLRDLSLLLVGYHTVGFHLGIMLLGRRKAAPEYPEPTEDKAPTVCLLIAARNEEAVIRQKIEDSLALDYPSNRLEIVVAANGCSDQTVAIANKFKDRGIRVYEYDEIGKTEAQNRTVQQIDSEIIVFSDANTLYDKHALRKLVAPFADDKVGCVSGRHVYQKNGMATSETESTYWNTIETKLKLAEARTGGMLGANGSIYAVRRDRYVPLHPDLISDFYEPLYVALNGYRTEYAPGAKSFEEAEANFSEEYRRKVRIVRRTVYGLLRDPSLLDPRRGGRLSVLLFSHKVLRWLTPVLLAVAVLASMARLITNRGDRLDTLSFLCATLFGFLGLLGRGLGREQAVPGISLAYYLGLMFRASITGMYQAISKGGHTIWDHAR